MRIERLPRVLGRAALVHVEEDDLRAVDPGHLRDEREDRRRTARRALGDARADPAVHARPSVGSPSP